MWNLKCTILPIEIGATGILPRRIRKNLESVPRKHSTDSLQKTAILGTSHIIRKVMQCEVLSPSGGDQRWFKRISRKKRHVTRDDVNNNNNNNNNTSLIFMSKFSSPSGNFFLHIVSYTTVQLSIR
jgi:hypothetical protein